MKILTRMRLINWHRFTNQTIDFENSVLLSGENGAGKSTLLDAIQFVITCSANYFNKAAHDNGKRKLTGYIRCKTGKENQPYERTGEISAHIALEFYEEKKQQYFVIGAVVDSTSEGQEKCVRYLMDRMTLDDIEFCNGRTPKSINQFRTTYAKKIKQWCKTDKDGKLMVRNRLGRIDEKFFRLIPKALAFRPIDDIKDFVYSYVLDQKEVNIDILRENVRTYQDLQRTLENVKVRIDKLKKIEGFHDQVMDGLQKDKIYEYYLSHVEADIIKEQMHKKEVEVHNEEYRLQDCDRNIARIEKEKQEKQGIRDNLYTELASDQDFIALAEQKKKFDALNERKGDMEPEYQSLMESVAKAKRLLKQLRVEIGDEECIVKYYQFLENIKQLEQFADLKECLQETLNYKRKSYEESQQKKTKLGFEKERVSTELRDCEEHIQKLRKKRFSYPPDVTRVLEAIQLEFQRIGRTPEPRVLCELLEIEDESWRNAVEGYLNTQRFYILVEPENFDIALGTYDKLRKERKAFGVGLINTQKLEKYSEAPEGSLATVVTSKNPYAKQYINMILGKVHMCAHYHELKQYKTAITKGCMKYQNHVANAIKPSIYETPYIGKQAIKVQLEMREQNRKELKEKLDEYTAEIEALERSVRLLDSEHDTDIKYRIDVLAELRRIKMEMDICQTNITTLEQNSNFLQKQVQLSVLEDAIKELDTKFAKNNKLHGSIEEKIRIGKDDIVRLGKEYSEKETQYAELFAAGGDQALSWEQEYQKLIRERELAQFQTNFTSRKKANLTIIDKAKTNMSNWMMEYKTAHDFGASPDMEGYVAFAAEYDKLFHSELLSYEEKVHSARAAAEDEFREQFLAKLQENMKNAQAEFKALNKALQDITFSNEKYEFLYMPSKRYRHYYEMIMDDFNAIQGESIFSGLFHQNHKEVIDELFDKLALDQENYTAALDEFTDYRTYMDYDIKILHSDNNYSFYSKVCEEKSGGETQTPFYVTVAASFVQLYRNSIGGEAVGLILFDEAFNNMDDERIGGVLEFLRRLPLQIIIAAPPDKIQYISPYVEETLLVMTDEKVSYVERYHNGSI